MKIRVFITLWQRPHVTKYCFDRLKKLQQESKHELKVLCVISESEYIPICEHYGFDWTYTDNNPLGKKINVGIERALQYDFDYLMMLNSDNVIKRDLIDEVYQPFFEKLNPFFGIGKVTYVNFGSFEAVEFNYDFSLLGIAKCIRRDTLQQVFNNLGVVVDPNKNKGIDDDMMYRFVKCGVSPTIVSYNGQLAMDFKSETNIHPWEKFENRGKKVCYRSEQEPVN